MQKWFYVNIYHVAVPLFYDYFLFPMFPSCWQMSVVFYHHVMHGLGFFIGSFWNQWIIRALRGQNSLCCKSWLHCTFKTVPNMPGSASVICHKLNKVNIFPFNTSRETCKLTLIKFKTKDFFFYFFLYSDHAIKNKRATRAECMAKYCQWIECVHSTSLKRCGWYETSTYPQFYSTIFFKLLNITFIWKQFNLS